ncbi:Soluble lytic murein transglycosylase [bacterium HR19]|nr:Soluble lytic murein transglycosylase [bacterium HR19]
MRLLKGFFKNLVLKFFLLVAFSFQFWFIPERTLGKIIEREPKESEVNIAKFAYGLKLLADYKLYDRAIFLLESGLDTYFSDWAKYYIGRAYIMLGNFSEAEKYLTSITSYFVFYDLVLQLLAYIAFQTGKEQKICERFESENFALPKSYIPEFFELALTCLERKIIFLRERGNIYESENLKERAKLFLYSYVDSLINPHDFIPYYQDRIKRAEDFSLRLYGKSLKESLDPNQREKIADMLFQKGMYRDVLMWTDDKLKIARAYFGIREYEKAVTYAESIIDKERKKENLEKLYVVLLFSYARKKVPDTERFESFARKYIELFSSERLAGDLAIKLAVEKYLKGITIENGEEKRKLHAESQKLLLSASQSAYEDIKNRARYILHHIFNFKISYKPEGFLFLIDKYKEGFSNLRFDDVRKIDIEKIDFPAPSKRVEELYFLKIYLSDSSLTYGLINSILNSLSFTQEEISWLKLRGFFRYFLPTGDFRSTFSVYSPPPVSFVKEIAKASSIYKVPRALIFSIALIESHFNPIAISPSRAIGVMQIIFPTAKEVFYEMKIPFTQDFLFEPEINIKAGTHYIWKLKTMLGSYMLAIAAYNAGPNAVKKWHEDMKDIICSNPELFLENIPYRQTRFYTMRALSYYLEYSKLLGDEINLDDVFGCKGLKYATEN